MAELPQNTAPRLRIAGRLALIASAIAAPLLAWTLSFTPSLVESAYTQGIGFAIAFVLARASSLVPFSLIEAIFGLLVLYHLVLAAMGLRAIATRRRTLCRTLARGALRLLTTLAAIVLLFYTDWGFNFARAALPARMGWPELDKNVSKEERAIELAALSQQLLDAANREYLAAHGCPDTKQSTAFPAANRELDPLLDAAYRRVAGLLSFPRCFSVPRGPAKPVILSAFLSRLLVLGFYSPWTGEANYNRNAPGCMIPHAIAHEKAHQRGTATEDEANFLGFLACASSTHPYVRYAGYLFAQRQIIIELGNIDPERAKTLLEQRLPGVQRDADAIRAFMAANAGTLSDAGRRVNSAYLKANRVKTGIESYSESATMLVLFARAHAGSCIIPSPQN